MFAGSLLPGVVAHVSVPAMENSEPPRKDKTLHDESIKIDISSINLYKKMPAIPIYSSCQQYLFIAELPT